MTLAVIDMGEQALNMRFIKEDKLFYKGVYATPKSLEKFYAVCDKIVKKMSQHVPLDGVAISSSGAVNQKTGIIEGASALPYIHNFDIHQVLEKRLELPVTLENDANLRSSLD